MKINAQQFVDIVAGIDNAHKEIAAFLGKQQENCNDISDYPSSGSINGALLDGNLRNAVQKVANGVCGEMDVEVFRFIAKDRARTNYMDSPYQLEVVEIFERIFDELAKYINKPSQE